MSATMQLVYYILLATVALGGLLFVLETIEAAKRLLKQSRRQREVYRIVQGWRKQARNFK
jgi:hypothetical protein